MRVLVVSPYYSPATCFGGPIRALLERVQALAARGFDVEVITTAADEPQDGAPRGERAGRVTVRYLPRFRWGGWFFSPSLGAAVFDRAPRVDVVSLQGVWSWPTAAGAAAARRFGKPYVINPQGSLSPWALGYRGAKKVPYLRLVEGRNLARAAAVHCLTRREADQVLALAPAARCEVIPNSVSLDPGALTEGDRRAFAARFPELAGRRTVLFLSRLHPIKGIELLVPAMARVRARVPEAHLAIAGPDEGGCRRDLEAAIAAHGLAGAVTFTGLLEERDKLAALAAAEVFVLPSHSEGMPVVVLEAMACGKPVVITDACNLTDEVRGAGAGAVVDADAEAIAGGIAALLADPARARAAGENGARLARERFSPGGVGDMLAGLYRRLGEGRGA